MSVLRGYQRVGVTAFSRSRFVQKTECMPQRSPQWSGVRAQHLAQYPACAGCGRDTFLEVHHIQPFHLFPDLELSPENLITLCERPGHDCHFHFGHFLDWYKYNPNVVADAQAFLTAMAKAP